MPALVPAEAPASAETPLEASVGASAPAAEAPAQVEAPAQYPSEHLIRSTSEENQIPSHLPACPSLRHIASLQGSAIVEFFHSSVAEVGPARLWRKVALSSWGPGRLILGLASGSQTYVCWLSPSFSCSQL